MSKHYVVVLVKTVEADSPEEAKERWEQGEGAGIGAVLDPRDHYEVARVIRLNEEFFGLAVDPTTVMDTQSAEVFGMRAPTPPLPAAIGYAPRRRRAARERSH